MLKKPRSLCKEFLMLEHHGSLCTWVSLSTCIKEWLGIQIRRRKAAKLIIESNLWLCRIFLKHTLLWLLTLLVLKFLIIWYSIFEPIIIIANWVKFLPTWPNFETRWFQTYTLKLINFLFIFFGATFIIIRQKFACFGSRSAMSLLNFTLHIWLIKIYLIEILILIYSNDY